MEYEVLWKVVVVIERGACKKYSGESTNIYCLDCKTIIRPQI